MVLASKGGIIPGVPYDSSADYLVAACEASLRRLGTDHLDLFQVHRPDVLAHPAEVASALETLVASGKARSVGVSNYTPSQTAALVAHLHIPLASLQPEFSPLVIEPLTDGTLDLAMQHGISVLAWSPLAGGRLGAPGDDERAQRVCAELDAQATALRRFARRRGLCVDHGASGRASSRSSAASRCNASARPPTHTRSSGPVPTGTGSWLPQEGAALP